MPDVEVSGRQYEIAANQKATEEERLDFWTVYDRYEVRELPREDFMAVAKPLEEGDLEPEVWGRLQRIVSKKGGRVGILPIYGEKDDSPYSPLLDTPALFLEFSRLADKGYVSQKEWIEWVRKYGVLGVPPGRKQDVYSIFVEEAKRASRTRRLFEAATRPRKPDLETIAELLPEAQPTQPRKLDLELPPTEDAALWAVEETVQRKVVEGCFPRLVKRDNYRQSRRSPFSQEWEFKSLLGAMWLQFMWLITSDKAQRRCEYCGGTLSPNRNSNARFCGKPEGRGKACKQAAKRERDRAAGKG